MCNLVFGVSCVTMSIALQNSLPQNLLSSTIINVLVQMCGAINCIKTMCLFDAAYFQSPAAMNTSRIMKFDRDDRLATTPPFIYSTLLARIYTSIH